MKINNFKHLNYSDIEINNVRIGVLNNPNLSPEDIAASFAAYSRSSISIKELLEERNKQDKSSSDICRKIIDSYGHGSIRGMGLIPIFIEGISMLDAMYIFYECPYQNGQERSTRYQLMTKSDSLSPFFIPESIQDKDLLNQYNKILYHWYNAYSSLYKPTKYALSSLFDINNKHEEQSLKSRTLDCVRSLLPMAKRTSIGFVINGTELSKLIARINNNPHTQFIANGLTYLLSNTNGVSNLIRYTQPYKEPTQEIMEILKNIPFEEFSSPYNERPLYIDTSFSILSNYLRLLHPFTKTVPYYPQDYLKQISSLIKDYYNHHIDMGNLGRGGSYIKVSGLADLGTIKDLNRHRPVHKLVSFLHKESNIKLDINSNDLFYLPEYLHHPSLSNLKKEYEKAFIVGYEKISKLVDKLDKTIIKYLLPHGHISSYCYSTSYYEWLFLISLRKRPGGHISYRTLIDKINSIISQHYPEFPVISTPIDIFDRHDFIDRS